MQTLDKLGAALAGAMKELKNPPRSKTVQIPLKSGGKFTFAYADLPTIIDIVRPVLAKHGLSILQPLSTVDGNIAVNTMMVHESGQVIESGAMAVCGIGGDAKDIGSRVTYMRRYALTSMLGLAADEDTDVADEGMESAKPVARKPAAKAEAPKPVPTKEAAPKAGDEPNDGTPMVCGKNGDDLVRMAPRDMDETQLQFAHDNIVKAKAKAKEGSELHTNCGKALAVVKSVAAAKNITLAPF